MFCFPDEGLGGICPFVINYVHICMGIRRNITNMTCNLKRSIRHWVELLDIRDLASVNSPTPLFSLKGGDGCSQTKEDLISDREVIMIGLVGDFTLVVSSLRLSKHQSLSPTVLF